MGPSSITMLIDTEAITCTRTGIDGLNFVEGIDKCLMQCKRLSVALCARLEGSFRFFRRPEIGRGSATPKID